MDRVTRCKLLVVILMSLKLIEAMQSQAMFPYYVRTIGIASERHLVISCGVKCNLEQFCQGFVISPAEADPCILLFENSTNLETAGNEVFYKEIEGE